jgi:hypothetical protein
MAVSETEFGAEKVASQPARCSRLKSLAVSIVILVRRSLLHKLLSGLWILALVEFREVLGRDRSDKAELPSYR